jgi:hypothetical protein
VVSRDRQAVPVERLDHLRPEVVDRDPRWDTHLADQEMEDYAFLRSRGLTHERALERTGMSHDLWSKRKERGG